MLNRNRRFALTALASILITTGITGCGGEAGAGGDTGGAGGGVTIRAAEFPWSAAGLTNQIIERVIEENPDLGVDKVTRTQLDPATAWAGAKEGDIDMIAEVVIPNQMPLAEAASKTMEVVSDTYDDAGSGWFVPSYVVSAGGAAKGLKSIDQLNDYKDVFDGKLYDADPGYVTTEQNKKRLDGFGIEYEQVVAGEAAELAQLKRAYERQEPILVFLYHPHWVFAEFDLVQLEEPNPYKEDCFTTGDGACAMPSNYVSIALSKELVQKAPNFASFIEDFRISVDEMEEMQNEVADGREQSDVAEEWIKGHAEEVNTWVSR